LTVEEKLASPQFGPDPVEAAEVLRAARTRGKLSWSEAARSL
jgi:hypothetical protein